MYIHRIILRDVKSIEHLDITLHDDWRDEPLKSILLTGPNGSGKTTILRVIGALWENYGKWLHSHWSLPGEELAQVELLANTGLAAVEIYDLAPEPVWIYVAMNKEYFDEFATIIGESARIGQILIVGNAPAFGSSPDFYKWLEQFRLQQRRLLTVGNDTSIPNLLFIDAETRFTPPSPDKKPSDFEQFYAWFVTYPFVTDNYGNLNKLLSNLKIRDPEWFYRFIKEVNGLFGEKKRFTDFEFSTLRLKMEINHGSDKFHYIEDLSSGEQQCLLLMYLADRWLMEGGIMLLDEPDLHLHESLQRHFIHELEKVVQRKKGQLIVTSHSQNIKEEFRREGQRIELREKLAL